MSLVKIITTKAKVTNSLFKAVVGTIGQWILSTGYWNDGGNWKDNSNWID